MEIREKKMYQNQWETFSEYVEEMRMSESSASKIISIYEKFVVQYQFEPQRIIEAGGWSQVAEILPMVKNKEDAEVWLEKSSMLTRKDLRDEMTEAKTGKSQITCPHTETYTVKICKECNVRIKVYEE